MAAEPADYGEALGNLVDALHDELAYEVTCTPHVRKFVLDAIDVLGGNYEGYRDGWLRGED